MVPKKSPLEGPFSLQRIKEVLMYKAIAAGIFQPLRSFFYDMELEWKQDAETAYAMRTGDRRIIGLGPRFFTEEVQTEDEAAEVVLHEIMHHLFKHLDFGEHFESKGYSLKVQNLAMDAVINAFLNHIKCAGFMERFYPDENEFAFLRPNSKSPDSEDSTLKKGNFYRRLYLLKVALEEALEFFKKEYPKSSKGKPLLGGHDKANKPVGRSEGGEASKEAGSKNQSNDNNDSDNNDSKEPGGSGRGENIFEDDEAIKILETMKLKKPPQKTLDNFLAVIKRITASALRPGPVRTGTRMSRRLPAKLGRRDLVNIERGRNLYARGEYRAREVWLFFDDSGSMAAYRPFCFQLGKSLDREGFLVHPVYWADGIKEIPWEEFLKGNLPDVGEGTEGEVVAKFLHDNNISHAAIITDNAAGQIKSKVSTKVYLCLVSGSSAVGSFCDRTKIANLEVYRLETNVC